MHFEVFAIGTAFVFGLLVRQVGLPPLVGFLAAGFFINFVGPGFGMNWGENYLNFLTDPSFWNTLQVSLVYAALTVGLELLLGLGIALLLQKRTRFNNFISIMMNAETLRSMKKGAVLVNTARGPLMDYDALYDVLVEGHLRGAMSCGEVRARFFDAPYPVTTTLEVSALYDPRLLVEITAIAEIPLKRFKMPETAQEKHQ